MTTDFDLLRDLCAAPAPTGFEAPVQEIVRRRLAPIAAVQGDPLGNVWGDVAPHGSPHVVVTAHSDQIGLIVTYVDEHGYVSFDGIGGIDAQLLPGRHLIIHGAKGRVNGVVGRKPSHKMSKDERAKAPDIDEQWLDVGAASRDEALALVQVGDPITFPAQFVPLANERYASPAFDNRAGVYVCVRVLEHYAAAPAAARLTALTTVHEETTFMGARAMAVRWQPDVIIVVDVDFASDDPGMDAKKLGGEVKLGAGPVIHRGAGSNHALVELAREVAAAEDIPIQIKAMPGATSTDAQEFMSSGQAATLSLSLPVRNMHSAAEVMQPADAEAGALLAAGVVRRLAEGWDRERFVPRA
jgi:endoglucanase